MPKITLQDRVAKFLTEQLGFAEVASRSKYRQFRKPGMNGYYFVGKNGAVRAGDISASDSVSLTDQVHANMKLWERKNEQP